MIALLLLLSQAVYMGQTMDQWSARLQDLDPRVRSSAVIALSNFGEPAVDLIYARIEDPNEDVVSAALEALRVFPERAITAYGKVIAGGRPASCLVAMTKSARLGIAAVPMLVAVWDEQNKSRRFACGSDGSSDLAAAALLPLPLIIEDRAAAATAAEPRLVLVVTEALRHPEPAVRLNAANALGALGRQYSAEAVPLLRGLRKDPDKRVQARAKAALEALGE